MKKLPIEYLIMATIVNLIVVAIILLDAQSKELQQPKQTPVSITNATWMPNTPAKVNQLANAIYKAENSKKYPYGIKSINTNSNEVYARKICKNTIVNNIKRFEDSGESEYLTFLANRYCPVNSIDDNGTNRFWKNNVVYFLNKDGE